MSAQQPSFAAAAAVCAYCREIIKLPPSALRGLKEGVADDMLAGEGGGWRGKVGGGGEGGERKGRKQGKGGDSDEGHS